MPILKSTKHIYIIFNSEKIKAEVLFETEKKIGLLLEDHSLLKKIKEENYLEFVTYQGNYYCTFQSKIQFLDYDYLRDRYLLEIDFPTIFRRTLLTVLKNQADEEKSELHSNSENQSN